MLPTLFYDKEIRSHSKYIEYTIFSCKHKHMKNINYTKLTIYYELDLENIDKKIQTQFN